MVVTERLAHARYLRQFSQGRPSTHGSCWTYWAANRKGGFGTKIGHLGHEPRAQSGARIQARASLAFHRHRRQRPPEPSPCRAPLPSRLTSRRPHTHLPPSERWRPLVVKKEMRFVLRMSSFLWGETSRFEEAWQGHFFSGL